VVVILIALFSPIIFGQPQPIPLRKLPSVQINMNEFSPVFYKNGNCFFFNRNLSLSNRTTSQNKGLFKILLYWYHREGKLGKHKLFSKNLTTILNDGPVSFNRSKDTIYFSRNQDVSNKLSDVSNPRNKLGIYSAVLVNGQWTKVRELRINNEWYNITTPCLSPDGKNSILPLINLAILEVRIFITAFGRTIVGRSCELRSCY